MAPPQKRAESEDLFERVLAGESVNDYETVRRRKDGTLVAVSIAAAPVRDGSGRVVSNMVAYTDITERKAQDAEVHRLNAELHARLEDLAASRARIVTAGDVERRRLERNLHDGAQQRLVTLSLFLRGALAKLDSDPAAARAALTDGNDELALALDERPRVGLPEVERVGRLDVEMRVHEDRGRGVTVRGPHLAEHERTPVVFLDLEGPARRGDSCGDPVRGAADVVRVHRVGTHGWYGDQLGELVDERLV
jgi:hypothetical protein